MFSSDHSFPTVKNLFNFVMFFAINKIWWWQQRLFLVRECQWGVGSEEYFVKHRMNAPVGWKFEGGYMQMLLILP